VRFALTLALALTGCDLVTCTVTTPDGSTDQWVAPAVPDPCAGMVGVVCECWG